MLLRFAGEPEGGVAGCQRASLSLVVALDLGFRLNDPANEAVLVLQSQWLLAVEAEALVNDSTFSFVKNVKQTIDLTMKICADLVTPKDSSPQN